MSSNCRGRACFRRRDFCHIFFYRLCTAHLTNIKQSFWIFFFIWSALLEIDVNICLHSLSTCICCCSDCLEAHSQWETCSICGVLCMPVACRIIEKSTGLVQYICNRITLFLEHSMLAKHNIINKSSQNELYRQSSTTTVEQSHTLQR